MFVSLPKSTLVRLAPFPFALALLATAHCGDDASTEEQASRPSTGGGAGRAGAGTAGRAGTNAGGKGGFVGLAGSSGQAGALGAGTGGASSGGAAGTGGAGAGGTSAGQAGKAGGGGQAGTNASGGAAGKTGGTGGAGQSGAAGNSGATGTSGTTGAAGKAGAPAEPPATLQQLWEHQARFVIDQAVVPIGGSGHREAFAVSRPDLGAHVLYLYHRCFPGGVPQICLLVSEDDGSTFEGQPVVVVAPMGSHPFAVAPSVLKLGSQWTMVYEEGGSAEGTYWATSADGKTWARQGAVWPGAAYRATPSLYLFQNTVYVFYAQFEAPGAKTLSINFGSGFDMKSLGVYGAGPVLAATSKANGDRWDGASVSMPRIVFDGAAHWMIFEAGSQNFLCGGSDNDNVFGWGLARSTTLTSWEKYDRNPIQQSTDGETCGHDMPQPVRLPDGRVFVYFTADDVSVVKRVTLAKGSACDATQTFPDWKEKNETCLPSCGGIGGTQCVQTKTCPAGKTEAGESYDCGSCCQ